MGNDCLNAQSPAQTESSRRTGPRRSETECWALAVSTWKDCVSPHPQFETRSLSKTRNDLSFHPA